MVYNTSQEAMILPKNLIVGWCQLVLQPSQDTYIQELAAMQQERCAEQWDEANNHHLAAMKLEERRKARKEQVDRCSEKRLSRDWVLDKFQLQDNPIIKDNPEVGEQLMEILQRKGKAFEGGAARDQVIGQGVAGRTDWIVARVELKPGEESPFSMKQCTMNPDDSAQLMAQLKLWQDQDLIRQIDSQFNSALLLVTKKNTVAKQFVINLRPLNVKCKKIKLYIGSVKQNL